MAKKLYTTAKNHAFTAKHGVVNDSIGRVIYALRSDSKIFLENLSDVDNNSLNTATNTTVLKLNSGLSNSIDCFYKVVSQKSGYSTKITDGKTVTYQPATGPTINVYKIHLSSSLVTLEIRNNDPWILSGVDTAPMDFFTSIAITKDEVATIISQLDGMDKSIHLLEMVNKTTVANPNFRPYYQAELRLRGSQNGSTSKSLTTISTGILVYSVDNFNWISNNYATQAFNLVRGTEWDNQIIPNPVTTNPYPYWQQIQTTLTNIISQANNLPVSNTKGSRLLTATALRDYLYSVNTSRLTFEIAFRLPFFTENPAITPYQTNPVTNQINNPYYTCFETWFGYANSIRISANLPQLSRTGLTESFTSAIQGTPDQTALYTIFGVTKDTTLGNYHIPAYIAAILNDENELTAFDQYFTVPSALSPKIRINNDARSAARSQKSESELSNILNEGWLTQASYDSLTQAADNTFVAVPIVVKYASSTNGYYVYKSAADNNFYIYDKITSHYYKGYSGITVAFGYDMGQAAKGAFGSLQVDTSFVYITGLSGLSQDQTKFIKNGFGISRTQAVACFYTYFDNVFSVLHTSYDWAVNHAQPLMKKKFLSVGIGKAGLNNPKFAFFQVYDSSSGGQGFYDPGANQYFNEVEKYVYGTQMYNAGAGSLNPGHRYINKSGVVSYPHLNTAMYFTHAVNTHDIRWMKEFLRPDNKVTSIWRREILRLLMNTISVYNHYNNIDQTSF